MLRLFKPILLAGAMLIMMSNAQADDQITTTTTTSPSGTVVKREIVTRTPSPKEVITAPTGYVSCFTVKGKWIDDVWAPEHDVCVYSNTSSTSNGGVVWVQGYWACVKYDINQGECINWDWKPAHWEKTAQ
ncbi:MAG TPA: hypothetical protein VNC84_07555 [Gammaproteobacteria bacterium]|nr:hypothetical protein [Gammaproteobacteria bacterium]